MTAPLGQVEHGEGATKCVHRVVRATTVLIEFVTRCDGSARFGTAATTVAYRRQFRRKLVDIERGGRTEFMRYVTADQVDRASETPAQREQRRARGRDRDATHFEARVVIETASTWIHADERDAFTARASAIAAAIRADGMRKHGRASRALLAEVRQLCALRELRSAQRKQETTAKRRARKAPAPWFTKALSLPSWPCSSQAVKSAFAAVALRVHPDHGGMSAKFIEVKRARDEALRALEGRAV